MLFLFIFQVIEFVQFKERLQHSNQYVIARLESSILRLKEKADNIEEEEVIFIATHALSYTLMFLLQVSLTCMLHRVFLNA